MTEEYIYERERDLLDYFRNNLTDPVNGGGSPRGTTVTDESFIATAGQTVFTLANTLVKNVADTITVNGVTKKKGYDYNVQYGAGSDATTITLFTGANLGEEVLITYYYGTAMVEREFSRTDATMPRVVMMFLTGSEEFVGLGDLLEDGDKGSYFNASFRFEIRDQYANRAREIASKAFNIPKKLRHANIFRVIISQSSDLQNFDFDPDKDAYVWQFTVTIQWDMKFE